MVNTSLGFKENSVMNIAGFFVNRRVINRVYSIQNQNGEMISDPRMIAKTFISYYQNLLGSDDGEAMDIHSEVICDGKVLTENQKHVVCRSFTENDVRNALWDIDENKSLASDGYTSSFFKKALDIVKTDVCGAMICTRLKEILPDIISEEQGAFVSGRAIIDNIMICQDLLKDYKNQRKPPRCTIQVDIKKAYDSLKWKFIKRMLKALSFPPQFVGVLTRLFKKIGQKRSFKFHHRCNPLKLNHLIFADDLMLFSYGNKASVSLLVRALKTFHMVSGLQANEDKTSIYFGNVSEDVKQEILFSSGFVEGDFPFKYLGIPLNSRYLRASDFDVLTDKIMASVTCWSSRNLSYAGRVVLINSILISFYSYWAQCVLMPKSVLDRINQLCRAYLWDGNISLSKAPPISWDWVCKPRKVGGMGIRNCSAWNKAALGKYVWKVACKKDSLWVEWVHSVYVKHKDWWHYIPGKRVSRAWKKICRVKEEMMTGFISNRWTEGTYTIVEGYSWILGSMLTVSWKNWIWNKFNIPKHTFIAWLAAQDRLRLRIKLYSIGVSESKQCLLCGIAPESLQHLDEDGAGSEVSWLEGDGVQDDPSRRVSQEDKELHSTQFNQWLQVIHHNSPVTCDAVNGTVNNGISNDQSESINPNPLMMGRLIQGEENNRRWSTLFRNTRDEGLDLTSDDLDAQPGDACGLGDSGKMQITAEDVDPHIQF
ncbi:uncharacterized protein LOC110733779 [Chenopodium quinoa]|uniref:uncharacterized protein LOC110733779 n=1 Tax=Chenopodium quinoa TaxID=63459 RepID=UPI000B76FA07|nr:uncharacterized protein LOC110733779 [Chenopodium quinoa]